jgi:F-box protein 21
MFVNNGDADVIEETSQALDRLAERVLDEVPNFEQYTTRQQALTLATFLRAQGFKGVSAESYNRLSNCFIGRAVQDHRHQCIPLIQCAIYCSVARRLDMIATMFNYPLHVYVIVTAPDGRTLDGESLEIIDDEQPGDQMYLDPFRSDQEVPRHDLDEASAIPGPESLLIARNSRNIVNAIRQLGGRRGVRTAHANAAETDNAFYSTLWALFFFETERRLEFITHIFDMFRTDYGMDTTLFEKFALPLFAGSRVYESIVEVVRGFRMQNHAEVPVWRRPIGPRDDSQKNYPSASSSKYTAAEIAQSNYAPVNPRYNVGQVFTHRRYGYTAVITGWDSKCRADEEWIQQMAIDLLQKGRGQCFYHIVADDQSNRYVAEENIQPIEPDEPPPSLLHKAGKFFKRWDRERCRFESNVKEAYPDD